MEKLFDNLNFHHIRHIKYENGDVYMCFSKSNWVCDFAWDKDEVSLVTVINKKNEMNVFGVGDYVNIKYFITMISENKQYRIINKDNKFEIINI